MYEKLTPKQVYERLITLNLPELEGYITFHLGNSTVRITTTDAVGITLQAWLRQWFIDNDIFFTELENTQEFPDFFLNDKNPFEYMLEVKAFNYNATPAFDIANFDSYCHALKKNPLLLNAYYLIFGYSMEEDGTIHIQQIWLKRIWEIAGKSKKYPLKTQVKKNVIYNIRPNSQFKNGKKTPFSTPQEFVNAIYNTISLYRSKQKADSWMTEFNDNMKKISKYLKNNKGQL